MSAVTVAAAFTAGLTTSVGPCMAPRYLALTAIAAKTTGTARWVRVACFVGGLLACYALLATTASLFVQLGRISRVIYIVLAAGFLAFGLNALLVRRLCTHSRHVGLSSSATLLTGGALGLVLSPCCTPLIALMAGVGAVSGSLTSSLMGVLAFTVGHVAPLATIGLGFGAVEPLAATHKLRAALTTVGGGLAIALAAYYGLLA